MWGRAGSGSRGPGVPWSWAVSAVLVVRCHPCSEAEPTGQLGGPCWASSTPGLVPTQAARSSWEHPTSSSGGLAVELSPYRARSGSACLASSIRSGFPELENFCVFTMHSTDTCPCPYCHPQWDTSALGDIIQLLLTLLGLGEQGPGSGKESGGHTQSSRARDPRPLEPGPWERSNAPRPGRWL